MDTARRPHSRPRKGGTSGGVGGKPYIASGVHERGVEPLSLAAPEPKSGAYASFATRALNQKAPQHSLRGPHFKAIPRAVPAPRPKRGYFAAFSGGPGASPARRRRRPPPPPRVQRALRRRRMRRARPLRKPWSSLLQTGANFGQSMIVIQWSHSAPAHDSNPWSSGRYRRIIGACHRRDKAPVSAIGGGLRMKSALEATWAGERRAQEFRPTYGA